MDKETLSNYGWIVILVLILAVMMALATPFGSFISTAIKDVTGGFWDVNSASLNVVGLDTGDIGFDGDPASCGVEGHYIGDNKGEHGIPVEDCKSGHTYTCECDRWVVPKDGKYTTHLGTIYTEGNKLPCGYIPQTGDEYVDNDYRYRFNYYLIGSNWYEFNSQNGWGVRVRNSNKTSYGEILESIANKPIVDMGGTFYNCTKLITAPAIPNGVSNMQWCFGYCTSLKTAPAIPSNVEQTGVAFAYCKSLTTPPDMSNATSVINMSAMFQDCTALKEAPVIPDSVEYMSQAFLNCTSLTIVPNISNKVKDMAQAFKNCTSLTTVSTIPESVTNMGDTFSNCTSLTGTVEINVESLSRSYECFKGVDFEKQNLTLTGISTYLDTLGNTGKNYCYRCNGKCLNNH